MICLDASVLIKTLIIEDPEEERVAALQLLRRAISEQGLVAPPFAWAEVGSALRRRVVLGEIGTEHADRLWQQFSLIPVAYLNSDRLRNRAWQISHQLGLPVLYDASYLACAELVAEVTSDGCDFWTADRALIRRLPPVGFDYVRDLAES